MSEKGDEKMSGNEKNYRERKRVKMVIGEDDLLKYL